MKKIFKILLVTLVGLLAVCTMFACNNGAGGGDNNANNAQPPLPGVLDVDAGSYEKPKNNAYGEAPDLDTVVIDGFLDDELWTADTMMWYTHYEATPRIGYKMAACTTSQGLYIAFRSYDPTVNWHGYNYFHKNTNIRFDLYTNMVGGRNVSIYFDANNLRPVDYFINGRCQYYGQLNAAGKAEGISAELYVKWEDLYVDVEKGVPDHIDILPLYNYCATPVAATTTVMRPLFVKTTGNTAQAIRFDINGYVDGDADGAIVGSHDSGMGKTNGWIVEKNEQGEETATSTMEATRGFPQVAFFKNTAVSSKYKVSTDIKIGKGTMDSRAGIIMYKDSINYRAVALQYNAKNLPANGKISSYNVCGYTNFPSNITMVKEMYSDTATQPFDTVNLTVYNNGGNLYYVLNGQYVYSEVASYVATNNYIGLYAFDTTATFTNYTCQLFEDEQDLLEDFQQYAYTVNAYNENPDEVLVEIDQIAVNKEGGSVGVTLTFGQGYALDDIGYVYNGEREEHSVIDDIEVVSGQFRMEIPGNVSIYTKTKKIDESELIDLNLDLVDADSGEHLYGLEAIIVGTGAYSRYKVRFEYGGTKYKVPKGNSWTYVASGVGYKETEGEIADGQIINDDMVTPAVVYVKSLVLGGTAMSALKADGTEETSFYKMSVPASTWDISKAEDGLAIFQTSATDAGEVYFSGRTISEYQVAYVEITNRTDPSAFASLENDPAAGFLIANENTTTYIGLRTTGLRIIYNRSVFADRDDIGGITGWNGHIPTVDRSNGGRFISSAIGKGTVNRIPNDDVEYTTSFMIIRKGGYTYVYAADGKQNVQRDKTNFDKMTLIYSFYNAKTNSPAAIGFGVTVAFNLRMDFENYWILSGDAAAKFADSEIGTSFTVNNGANVSIKGSGLLSYDSATGKGKMVNGSELTFTANNISKNKILKATVSSGEVYYLYNAGESFKHTNTAGANMKVTFEEVESIVVKGTVKSPDGTPRRYAGYLYNANGERITSISSKTDGSFSIKIEKGGALKIAFAYDGYAMNLTDVPADGNVGQLTFVEIPIGGTVNLPDGKTDSSSPNAVYGYSDKDGVYFDYQHNNAEDDGVFIKDSKITENMVIDFTYNRYAKPASTGGKEDGDVSVGAVFYGPSGSYGMRFIGDGYRIMLNDSYSTSTNINSLGLSNINLRPTSTAQPINFRFIKIGSIVYMCCKPQSQAKYDVILAFDLMPHVGDALTDVEISWCSYGWSKFKITNVNVEDATGKTVTDYASTLNTNTFSITGAEYLSVSGPGMVSYDANSATGAVVMNSELALTATGLPVNTMLKVTVAGIDYYASEGSTVMVGTGRSGNTEINATVVSGSTVKGKVAYPKGVNAVKLNGAVRNAYGEKYIDVTTDYNGNFEVFVDGDNDYYVSFYLDGYVMTPVKIEGNDVGTLEFKNGMLASSTNLMNGTVGSDKDHVHNVYEHVDGSLNIDMCDANAYDGGIYLKSEFVKKDMVISFTYTRHAKPSSVAGGEDGDSSFGLVFGGTTGKMGVRFIGTGYRIMQNDDYSTATNIEKRGVSPVDLGPKSNTQPYYFKFIKVGSVVYMCAKTQSQANYTVVYTLDLMSTTYSVGSELTDIQLSWVSHGYYDITIGNIKIEDVDSYSASEVYREFNLSATEGGTVFVNGEKKSSGVVDGYKDAYLNINIVPSEGKMLSKLIVAGVVVDLAGYNGGEFTYKHKVTSGGDIIVEYKSPAYNVEVEVERTHANKVKSIVATSGSKSITFTITENKALMSESVAYLNKTGKKVTVILPEGEWKLTLYSDTGATVSIGEYDVTAQKN